MATGYCNVWTDYYKEFDDKYHFYEKKVESGKGEEISMSFILPIKHSNFEDLQKDILDGDENLFNFIRTPIVEKKEKEKKVP